MININELRIGSIVYDDKNNKAVIVTGLSDEGYVTTKDKNGLSQQIEINNIEGIAIDSNLINNIENQGIVQAKRGSNNIKKYFFLQVKTSTFFLVHHKVEKNYFIGMIDVELPEGYRRITRPFDEYHKLQNSFLGTFDVELKELTL